MTGQHSPDPDRKWRVLWRIAHSPFILLPAVMAATAAAADDVKTAVMRHGLLLGAAIGVPLLLALAITLLDLVPHLVKWLRAGHAHLSAALATAGRAIDALAERITKIISDG